MGSVATRILGAILTTAMSLATASVSAADLWLSGVDPIVRQVMKPGDPSDYAALFAPRAPWPNAARQVRVFKTSTQYLTGASDDDLRRMFAALDRLGVLLAVEALMTPGHPDCGQGIEGYSGPGVMRAMAERVKRLGGRLAFAAMDEPLWYGHHFDGKSACRSTIPALAEDIAKNVADLRAVFPGIKIGDIEPLASSAAVPGWPSEILQFAAAYRAATGGALDFFDADIDWTSDWKTALGELAPSLRAAGIRYGVIFNGDPQDVSDLAWTRHAEARFDALENLPSLAPDDAILQTWMLRPEHMLPETQPGTMTNLVLLYARSPTHLRIDRRGATISGTLTDARGAPVANVPVMLTAADPHGASHLTARTLSGVVPAGSTHAVVAIRINSECGGCAGTGEVALGLARYSQSGGPEILRALVRQDDETAQHIKAVAGHAVSINSANITVRAGLPFTFAIPIDASAGMAGNAYAALIFLDDKSAETVRIKIPITTSEMPLGAAKTDSTGAFRQRLGQAPTAGTVISGSFPGTDRLRPAVGITN